MRRLRFRLNIVAGVVLPLLFLAATTAAGADTVTARTNYYTVTGTNAAAIRTSLSRAQVRQTQGGRDGATRWDVRYTYRYELGGEGARLSEFTTATTIGISLPRWAPEGRVTPELTRQWGRYARALAEHEHGHHQTALDAAAALRQRARVLPAASSAAALRAAVDQLARDVLAEFRRRDADYDRRTRHGATQGAVFNE